MIALRNGGILNENDNHCRVADLENKLRINLSIYPRNISGPAISIRKHRHIAYKMDDLVRLGMLDITCKELVTELLLNDKTIILWREYL